MEAVVDFLLANHMQEKGHFLHFAISARSTGLRVYVELEPLKPFSEICNKLHWWRWIKQIALFRLIQVILYCVLPLTVVKCPFAQFPSPSLECSPSVHQTWLPQHFWHHGVTQWTYQHGVFTDQLQGSIFYYALLLRFSDQ